MSGNISRVYQVTFRGSFFFVNSFVEALKLAHKLGDPSTIRIREI